MDNERALATLTRRRQQRRMTKLTSLAGRRHPPCRPGRGQLMKQLFPYGLDAPPVVRNLLLCSLACWLLMVASLAGWLPITVTGLQWPALSFAFGAVAMTW